MSNNFFETESAHSNIMYWWHGVIVDDKFWAGCGDGDVSNENSKIHIAKQLEERPKKGWGKRYKVAIVGRHYDVKANPNEADLLEMAEVVYPVTAGSGLGGTKQTAALRQGTHVIGFYADGKEGRNPIILGAFGVNEQNEPIIYPGDPPRFFQARSATKGACGERLRPLGEKEQNLNEPTEIHANDSPLQASKAVDTKSKDGGIVEEVYSTTGCEKSSGIINQIKSLLNKLSYVVNLAKQGASDLTANLQNIIRSITNGISGLANGLMDRMRGFVTNKINNGVKDLMNLIPPYLRPSFNEETQKSLTSLSCAFNNIKNGIYNIVDDLIKQFIDNYINAPLCAATNFLGSLLGNVIGSVNGIIDGVVGSINGFLNLDFGISGNALDVLDFALDVLGLFDCDRDSPECPGTTKWSFWRGPNELSSSIQTKVSRKVDTIIKDVETALPGSSTGANSNPCNSRQIPCGPPTIQIDGGGGSGARANPVISVTGKILGLDFSVFGSGYTSNPRIDVVDSCGTGGGAVIRPFMRPTGTFNEFQEELMELTGAVVLDSGIQYLPAPNGTFGGNGLIFSRPNDTILFKTGTTQIINGKEVAGVGYDVYKPGTTISLKVNDEIYLPSGTLAYIYNKLGEIVQTLIGLGQQKGIIIKEAGTLTTPSNPDNVETPPQIEYPLIGGEVIPPTTGISTSINGKNSYPIVAEIESVFIKNPGFGYKDTDTILISNNKGAILDFKVNDSGQVTEVSVVNGGLGFTDVPYIFIESPTGYNFEAVAVFKFTQLSDINLNNVTPPPGAKLISVIDCVGKIQQ
jgi:hypothetical protein